MHHSAAQAFADESALEGLKLSARADLDRAHHGFGARGVAEAVDAVEDDLLEVLAGAGREAVEDGADRGALLVR